MSASGKQSLFNVSHAEKHAIIDGARPVARILLATMRATSTTIASNATVHVHGALTSESGLVLMSIDVSPKPHSSDKCVIHELVEILESVFFSTATPQRASATTDPQKMARKARKCLTNNVVTQPWKPMGALEYLATYGRQDLYYPGITLGRAMRALNAGL